MSVLRRHNGIDPVLRHLYEGWVELATSKILQAFWLSGEVVEEVVGARQHGTFAPARMGSVHDVRDQLVIRVVSDKVAGAPHGKDMGVAPCPVGREVGFEELSPKIVCFAAKQPAREKT